MGAEEEEDPGVLGPGAEEEAACEKAASTLADDCRADASSLRHAVQLSTSFSAGIRVSVAGIHRGNPGLCAKGKSAELSAHRGAAMTCCSFVCYNDQS